ncbi:MAG: ribosome small subunit-dependent GTPase A [Pseudomonadales bacterium]|jgi:ribosome biogenesis GTPase|nr:ribosome small subunit-dependent GTPase A [Pseudomonadales bacterium]
MSEHPTHSEMPSPAAPTLRALGFSTFFRSQCPADREDLLPARVLAVERTGVLLAGPGVKGQLPIPGSWFDAPPEERPTVGDWVLVARDGPRLVRLLERSSRFVRVAPGGDELQLIAANVDVVLLVSACNQEFNLARLERYLALVLDAGATPVVVLTKRDLAEDPEAFVQQAARLRPGLAVELVNALDAEDLAGVRAWCTPGSTVALLGSSGVGKSTLLNTLAGAALQQTGAARDDDDKGRHTTTRRSLHRIDGDCWILDAPGMRELGLVGVEAGLEVAFDDIAALASACRFRDCSHHDEPGCAVRAAVERGELEARRLTSFLKLQREDRHARESIAERRARARRFDRVVRHASAVRDKRRQ